jgi:hypothetical protein
MADGMDLGQAGVLQVIPPAALDKYDLEQAKARADAQQPKQPPVPELCGYIKGQFEIFRNHRNTVAGWSNRMIEALRTYNGQYNPTKMQEVKKFGGSEIYARLSAQKCRATTSLLRDIYMGPDQPWGIRAPADPDIPPEIIEKIRTLMQTEQQMIAQTTGQTPSQDDLDKRSQALLESAREAAKKKAHDQARISEEKIEELLREGGFYHALAEFLVDLPIFPYACIKGPVVKFQPKVMWPYGGGRPTIQNIPTLTWVRVSPFDLWWTPGVSDISNAQVIEKSRLTRHELNDCLDLPGFNHDEVRAVLTEYGRGGLYDAWDTTDAERAVLESRENPAWNRSQMITQYEFNGNVYGEVLAEYGMPGIVDPVRDYHIQAWCIGSHVIKVNMSPSPRARHPYFITSFEKVPGTPIGNGLTDITADLQESANATLRALVNNMSIASGPQVVINDDRVLPTENTEDLFPWKRWHARNDPVGSNNKSPVEFFQPQDNSQSLMMVFKMFVDLGDDISAIPRYISSQNPGSAGRTASGLSMLMSNASKMMQTVAANIDRDVFEVALQQLSDLILLTDTSGLLTGEEDITVQGVSVAVQRETQRQRQLEFLQHTANPLDQQIMGIKGRGTVLRSISQDIGLDGDEIVPTQQELEAADRQQKQQVQQGGGNVAQQITKGIQEGVEAGVKRISTELVAGLIAQQTGMPEGMPTHLGTLPGQPGATPMGQAAAQAQGSQPTPPNQSQGPQTNLTGSQPAPPGQGPQARPPAPAGGPQ